MQFSTQQFLIAIAFICVVIGAFARGNHLLGTGAGITFAILAMGSLFVVWRVFASRRRLQIVRQIAAVLFAVTVLTILTIPDRFSPDLAYFIDGHNIERVTRSQLHDVLAGDPRFSNLDFRCNYTKCIVVSVNGNIKTESDLLELRQRIFDNCPHVSSRWLYWELNVDESSVTHDDCDLSIFGEPKDGDRTMR